jgi:autotransporter-associated beta strand protein
MFSLRTPLSRAPLWLATLLAAACGSDGHGDPGVDAGSGGTFDAGVDAVVVEADARDREPIPAPPTGVGAEDTAEPPADVIAYVDDGATNRRDSACHVTIETNAGVRVLRGFLAIWRPSSMRVDAGVTLPESGPCAAVTPAGWSGIPGDPTDGTVLHAAVHTANIAYVETVTQGRTPSQELAAYLDDRRGKNYSLTDALGPLTAAWRSGARQVTSITGVPADATTVPYNDTGNNRGVGSATNPDLGLAVDFIGAMSGDGSTEPAKRFFKYARPWRWSSQVIVPPSLMPVRSSTPATDSGFMSGHAAEGWRDALAMAYLVPERYQELIVRAAELGENRILAGMHSPLDVMGGRVQATAVVAYNLNRAENTSLSSTAYAQAQTYLMAQAGVTTTTDLDAYAHAGGAADRFADHAANRAAVAARLTYGFAPIESTTKPPIVPRGAEILLATRLPYLSAAQRRVVLKTTSLASGFPVIDDEEGWGRLNLFAAADGYGAFTGDVTVDMDAAQGGFSALDRWRNDITGPGKLTKRGTGVLRLTGANRYTGGTEVAGGTLAADSTSALGTGDVYVSGGTLQSAAPGSLVIGGRLTLLPAGTLELVMASAGRGTVLVSGAVFVDGAALHVAFTGGYRPAVGDTLWIVVGGTLHGRFASVTVDGFSQVMPIYDGAGMRVQLVAN